MNEIVTLPSGAKLELQMVPLALGCKLRRTAATAFKGISLTTPLEQLQQGNFSLNDIKDVVLQALCDETLENDLNVCLRHCLYNETKIDAKTFEEAREDYIQALWEVARYNLTPFFKNLGSLFSEFVVPSTNVPK